MLSARPELIGNLLRTVYPAQTVAPCRDHGGGAVRGIPALDGVSKLADGAACRRSAWFGRTARESAEARRPGTITQWADDALEGAFVKGPVGNVFYEMKPFNSSPVDCGDNGGVIADTILKPPPLVDANPASGARARLDLAADAAQNIDGHYRFFGYSQPIEVLYSSAVVPGNWADGTVGSVCSAFVWRSMKDGGIHARGRHNRERGRRRARRGGGCADAGRDVHLHRRRTCRCGGVHLQDDRGTGPKEVSGFEDLIADVSDNLGNQMVNCFGFDWCGETFSTFAGAAGCDLNDERAQDSPCWLNEGPGIGRAVDPTTC